MKRRRRFVLATLLGFIALLIWLNRVPIWVTVNYESEWLEGVLQYSPQQKGETLPLAAEYVVEENGVLVDVDERYEDAQLVPFVGWKRWGRWNGHRLTELYHAETRELLVFDVDGSGSEHIDASPGNVIVGSADLFQCTVWWPDGTLRQQVWNEGHWWKWSSGPWRWGVADHMRSPSYWQFRHPTSEEEELLYQQAEAQWESEKASDG